MRANKNVFWISIVAGIVSIVGIVVFSLLYSKYDLTIYSIFNNIFISLVGGAFLSAVTSYVGYVTLKREKIVAFSSQMIAFIRVVKQLRSWESFYGDEINYKTLNDFSAIEDKDERLKLYLNNITENNNKVKEFFNIVKYFIDDATYNSFYIIADDYCDLITPTKRKRKKGTKTIRDLLVHFIKKISKYNVLFDNEKNVGISLYKTGVYDEQVLYMHIGDYYKNQLETTSVEELSTLTNEIINKSKINDFLKKIYQSEN